MTIYKSLFHPHILYGLTVWGFQHERVNKIQKKAIRILTFKPYLAHTTPLFKQLNILNMKDLYNLQLFKLYYKNTNNLLPTYFQCFTLNYDDADHNHDLRHTTFRLPMTRREYFVQSTKYQYLQLIRDTEHNTLNRSTTHPMYSFTNYLKYQYLDEYDPICHIPQCYVCNKYKND